MAKANYYLIAILLFSSYAIADEELSDIQISELKTKSYTMTVPQGYESSGCAYCNRINAYDEYYYDWRFQASWPSKRYDEFLEYYWD